MTYGFIGTGHMGGALARAAAQAVPGGEILLCNRTADKAAALAASIGAQTADNAAAAAVCDYLFLGVKPQMMAAVLAALAPALRGRRTMPVLVSMAAGLRMDDIRAMAGGDYPTVRIMPNTAVAVGEGVTLYCCSPEVTAAQRQGLLHVLSKSGIVEELEESLIDAGSAVAGCGGAYAALFLEGLADGGVYVGLPRQKALRFAAQMLRGAASQMLAEGEHPGIMKDAVCSPGGTTIAGVRALEARGFRSAAMEAVIAARDRTQALRGEIDARK